MPKPVGYGGVEGVLSEGARVKKKKKKKVTFVPQRTLSMEVNNFVLHSCLYFIRSGNVYQIFLLIAFVRIRRDGLLLPSSVRFAGLASGIAALIGG